MATQCFYAPSDFTPEEISQEVSRQYENIRIYDLPLEILIGKLTDFFSQLEKPTLIIWCKEFKYWEITYDFIRPPEHINKKSLLSYISETLLCGYSDIQSQTSTYLYRSAFRIYTEGNDFILSNLLLSGEKGPFWYVFGQMKEYFTKENIHIWMRESFLSFTSGTAYDYQYRYIFDELVCKDICRYLSNSDAPTFPAFPPKYLGIPKNKNDWLLYEGSCTIFAGRIRIPGGWDFETAEETSAKLIEAFKKVGVKCKKVTIQSQDFINGTRYCVCVCAYNKPYKEYGNEFNLSGLADSSEPFENEFYTEHLRSIIKFKFGFNKLL